MKKIIAIQGSPRKNMNTDLILNSVLEGLQSNPCEIKKVYAYDLNINPCKSCYYCSTHKNCIIDDDMQDLYKLFDSSDGIIIASPLYFSHISAPLKMIIDRCQMFWSSKYHLKSPAIDISKPRTGLFISTAGATYDNQFSGCKMTMDLFFKSINTNYKHDLLYRDTDTDPVNSTSDILKNASQLGLNFFK